MLNFAFETACQGFAVKPGDANVEKAFAVLAKKAGIYGMVGGQVLDVERAGLPMDEDQLAFIYENKTGALIAAACMCGAYLAGADDAVVAQLDEAAYAVGFAFQVQDDILDLVGDEQLLGKPLHSDDKNHKVTYVTLHGMDAAKQYVEEMSEKAIRILENIKASAPFDHIGGLQSADLYDRDLEKTCGSRFSCGSFGQGYFDPDRITYGSACCCAEGNIPMEVVVPYCTGCSDRSGHCDCTPLYRWFA